MITLNDIEPLRTEATQLRDTAWQRLMEFVRAQPTGLELLSTYDSARRELAVIDKMERELLANGKTTVPSAPSA